MDLGRRYRGATTWGSTMDWLKTKRNQGLLQFVSGAWTLTRAGKGLAREYS